MPGRRFGGIYRNLQDLSAGDKGGIHSVKSPNLRLGLGLGLGVGSGLGFKVRVRVRGRTRVRVRVTGLCFLVIVRIS